MRNNESLKIVRVYARMLVKREQDPFAAGAVAIIDWLLDEDCPCPFAEVIEELDATQGWISPTLLTATTVPTEPTVPTHEEFIEQTRPRVREPLILDVDGKRASLQTEEVADTWPKVPGVQEGIVELAQKHSWLKDIISDPGINAGVPITNRNAVVVGQGLRATPALQDQGSDDEFLD